MTVFCFVACSRYGAARSEVAVPCLLHQRSPSAGRNLSEYFETNSTFRIKPKQTKWERASSSVFISDGLGGHEAKQISGVNWVD